MMGFDMMAAHTHVAHHAVALGHGHGLAACVCGGQCRPAQAQLIDKLEQHVRAGKGMVGRGVFLFIFSNARVCASRLAPR
jgi:hypothetical protein